jgi:multicomponent Na+:H+ antiporter subunit F
MPEIVIVVALACVVGLLAVGAAVLLRARDVLERIVALDLLTVICVALLALLAYLRGVSYYLDAALALSALSFVATLAAVRSDGGGGPFRD